MESIEYKIELIELDLYVTIVQKVTVINSTEDSYQISSLKKEFFSFFFSFFTNNNNRTGISGSLKTHQPN